MFSSFPQYLLLAPSFTNVLNVYAFCNLHDVSWGTKGSDKADALPSMTSKKGKEEDGAVVEDTTKLQEDVDAAFKETVTRAVTKVESKEEIEKPTMDDQNKTFRTRLVAAWMLSNAGLSVAIQNLNGTPSGDSAADEKKLQSRQQFYFSVILYSTFALALVRFIGVSFLISRPTESYSFSSFLVLVLLLQTQPLQMLSQIIKCKLFSCSFNAKEESNRFFLHVTIT